MNRHVVLTGLLRHVVLAGAVAAGASGAQAAERATFVLVDGSRRSGEIVFHGAGNRNIVDNFLNLGQSGGADQTYPMDQVALIEFDATRPRPSEFQQIPAGDAHLIVLRNGDMRRGRLMNMINGDTVQWRDETGQPQEYPIRDVSRIYLNADAARRVYPQVAVAAAARPSVQGTSGATTGADAAIPRGPLRVPANQQWVPTGIVVRKGQLITFAATGQVRFGRNAADVANADGNRSAPQDALPVAGMPVGGLIARVGSSPPFPVGSNQAAIAMPETGVLMLGINDVDVGDNSGEFIVELRSAGR